ncbi:MULTISPECIES: LacI family DNA-binding transcriptional regulator [Microbacterium]|uniref:LacI family DNA-binding transcriptional regulator n=1 Tax=Microbacterium wangchenii TaxID=2541726 RepID=A0ABX5SUC4_9MICO|nr:MULTISPECIES: LacI family DNA-binding transcriptional regulator [Microbacterium]MCK6067682.1 LacI family DNA-binding transcriptional regulator [Microbacterium sp. EYE_512]QBR89402.1 LacI family DNA-binding transcriptional regulator [Microbacterium wangchenii]TFV81533.1 LacI family DNA-binding transcriptional regulator [Microbacterium sp. dk485]TXK11075.1 LacI family DNA-binding transcriptional regulator [Microbacterium wangchenii]
MSEDANGRRPSIRDVARLADVSHQTVSRVLNNHPSIRPETRARVLEVMTRLQYSPNRAARALVTSRSQTIGILSASSTQYGPASSIAAIEAAARARGYWVSTANIDARQPDSIAQGLRHLTAQSIEGLVVIAPQVRVIRAIAAQQLDVPYVTLQSTVLDPGHTLSVDQIAGARLATRHLIELGHREIYHLAGPQDWVEAEARMRGFLEEMSAQDLPTTAPILGDWTADFGYYAGRELLRVRDFTAIFSSNDQMALGLLHAVRDEGLDVPGDISIVGFDDIPEAAHFAPPLTTVRQDFGELGRRCVDLLLGTADPSAEPVSAAIEPELIVRASTGRAVAL